MPKLYIERLFTERPLPKRATKFSAGMDIHAIINNEYVVIYPHCTVAINTGLRVMPEEGYHIELYPRSGLAYKLGINLTNCIGVIDRDYRDEVKVLLHNETSEPVKVYDGERICQMLMKETIPVEIVEVSPLPEINSDRIGGFGSTGK